MKIEIFKDGAVQGWFVNTVFTLFTMTMLGCGFFIDKVRTGWVQFGGIYATIFLGSLTAWFAYKVANKKIESNGGSSAIQQESIADALKKIVESMSSFQASLKKE